MIQVKRALKSDLNALTALMGTHAKFSLRPEMFNKRDVALKAVDTETGAIVGFIWGGLMAQNSLVYIDKFTVHPEYSRKGVGNALYLQLLEIGKRIGIKYAFGYIRHDQYHEKSAMNALKMAGAADHLPYTHVYGDVANIVKELEILRAS